MKRSLLTLSAAVAAVFAPVAMAQMSCADLGAHLATQPHITQVNAVTPLTTLTTTGSARCEANFIYSSRGGMADGYAAGQDQRIVIRVGLPRNDIDGGDGGAEGMGAWNGRVMNLGGGGLVGNVGGVTGAYNDAAERYKGYGNLAPWFRFYLAPGVGHCGGGGQGAPPPQNLFGVLVDWVENDVAPDSILTVSQNGRNRPMCPYPQTAIFNRPAGGENITANWSCGGNLENKGTTCDGRIAPFQRETEDEVQAVGRRNPAACNPNSKVPPRQ